jgi:hypothetical protein
LGNQRVQAKPFFNPEVALFQQALPLDITELIYPLIVGQGNAAICSMSIWMGAAA